MTDTNDNLCPLPARTDWTAKWVWVPDSAGYAPRNSYAFFRKRFDAAGSLTVDVAADTRCDLFLDGKRIDRVTAPSMSAYKTFDTHRVVVEPGEHVVAAVVHHIGEMCATAQVSRPGLFVQIRAQSGEVIGTDSTWKVIPGGSVFRQDLPAMMSHFGFWEECDCRGIAEDWTELEYDDSSWLDGEEIGRAGCEPWLRMIPKDIPHLRTTTIAAQRTVAVGSYIPGDLTGLAPDMLFWRTEFPANEMHWRSRVIHTAAPAGFPIKLGESENGFAALDFGREVSGHVRLLFDGAGDGQQIDIGYDELLDARGLPDPRRTTVKFTDRLFLRQGQRQCEVFDARGFRYLLIDVPAGKGGITLMGAEIDERTYPVDSTSTFRCSDSTLEMLYRAGIECTRLCMLDSYVDCPSRERVAWMDSYIQGLVSSYGMGVTDLWRRILYLHAQDLCKEGCAAGLVKGYAVTDREATNDTYAMYYVCSVADYVRHSGDIETGRALSDTVMQQLWVLYKLMTPDGIYGDTLGGFLDWSGMDYGGVSAADNAILLVALRKGEWLARLLGMTAEADRLAAVRGDLLIAYIEGFLGGKGGPVRRCAV